MRYASSTGTRRSSSSSTRAALSIDECVCSRADDDAAVRHRARAPRRARSASRRRGVLDVPVPLRAAGRAAAPSQPSRRAPRARRAPGDVRQRMPTWFSATVSSSARIAGSEPVFAKYAKKRGCCQCVTAGRISRVEVLEQRRERLGPSRAATRAAARAASRARPARAPAARRRARGTTPPTRAPRAPSRLRSTSAAAS